MPEGGQGEIRPAARCTLEADHPCSLPAGLQGARVPLTGASAGVGEELACHYARLGSRLVLTARTEAFLPKVRHPFSVGVRVGWKMGCGFESLPRSQVSHVTLGKLLNLCEP